MAIKLRALDEPVVSRAEFTALVEACLNETEASKGPATVTEGKPAVGEDAEDAEFAAYMATAQSFA